MDFEIKFLQGVVHGLYKLPSDNIATTVISEAKYRYNAKHHVASYGIAVRFSILSTAVQKPDRKRPYRTGIRLQ